MSGVNRSFLKWPGGKARILNKIFSTFPGHFSRFIEPFCGSGVVFLNQDQATACWLNDLNPDLIAVYRDLQQLGEAFIGHCRILFTPFNNNEKNYYRLRQRFNELSDDCPEKSALFLYLNRHGYNGLCRYNSRGLLNVPFGRYKKSYFPETELKNASKKLQAVKLTSDHFAQVLSQARSGDLIYCDPPYFNHKNSFTNYCQQGFYWSDHCELARWASILRKRGVTVVISNHDTAEIRRLYQKANSIQRFLVSRTISCVSQKRQPVFELLAVYQPV